MSQSGDGKKKRKTKLEKICELESNLKIAKEENRRLKKELQNAQSGKGSADAFDADSSFSHGASFGAGFQDGDSKLKEALRALKRVTVKQELSLKTLREKSHQRRKDIERKDGIIDGLKEEVSSLKTAYERFMTMASGNNDVETLRARVAQLELKLATEDTKNEAQNKRLVESKQSITSLKDRLGEMRGKPQRVPSSRSLKSTESGASVEDVMKLKRELATKMEKIASLEYELEESRDEVHELKQKQTFDGAFPAAAASSNDEWFSDHEDDEFWG